MYCTVVLPITIIVIKANYPTNSRGGPPSQAGFKKKTFVDESSMKQLLFGGCQESSPSHPDVFFHQISFSHSSIGS